jgi:nucleoid DNA-binding protein
MAKAAKSGGAKKSGGKKTMTKSQFVARLAEKSEISKKQADAVLNEMLEVIKEQVGPKGPGKFVIPGLCRITVTRKEAQPGGEKKINRLTGQEYVTKPKPAYNRVNVRPVKALKTALA